MFITMSSKSLLITFAFIATALSLAVGYSTNEQLIKDIREAPSTRDVSESDVTYYIFTQELNGTHLTGDEVPDAINTSLPIVFIIHGWQAGANESFVAEMAYAFLTRGNYNVLAVDWSEIAMELYTTAAGSVDDIGNIIGALILDLYNNYGVDLATIELAGHSLGAHVSGFAGQYLQETGNVTVGRITGMDPAGPFFNDLWDDDDSRVSPTDADLVVIIHSDAGKAGFPGNLGDIDFYPNGGDAPQPGCIAFQRLDFELSCSHERSYEIYIEALQNAEGFVSTKCSSYLSYLLNFCANNPTVTIGGPLTLGDSGTYYLKTNAESPYSED